MTICLAPRMSVVDSALVKLRSGDTAAEGRSAS